MIDVAAATIEQDSQVLLAQHLPHTNQPEVWEFVGGRVEPDESQSQAPAHELQEEMGIIAYPACCVADHQREAPGRQIHLHVWQMPHFQGILLAHYHAQLRWCLFADALTPDLTPTDIPLLHVFIAQRPALSGR